MKPFSIFALLVLSANLLAQGHDVKPADAMRKLSFWEGAWTGKQVFNTGGAPMTADVSANVHFAIGGRYIEEVLSATVPGRKPSDTRHFLTFDPESGKFRAWWFNDSSFGAMELEGELAGDKLVLTSKPTKMTGNPGAVLRVTYTKVSDMVLTYGLELKKGEGWMQLFLTTLTKKA